MSHYSAAGRAATSVGTPSTPPETAGRILRYAIAFVWLATGMGVLHPYYRRIGEEALAPLGLPAWVMVATCLGEIALGLRVALVRSETWLTALQIAAIAAFTAILSVTQPGLWLQPLGVLSKNLPLLAILAAAWMIERRGWDHRGEWILRFGLAAAWIADGLAAQTLYGDTKADMSELHRFIHEQRPTVVRAVGAIAAASGLGLVILRGESLRVLLVCQLMVLIAVPIGATFLDPLLWFHPFGPLTKNVPLIAATWVLLRRRAGDRMA
jgi:hypothetical protein